jgi:hypothetical protein
MTSTPTQAFRNLSHFVILATIWAIPIVFHKPIELAINILIAEPILSQFHESLLSELVFISLIVYLILILCYFKFRTKSYLDWNGILYLLLLSSYVILYRFELFDFKYWTFERLSHFKCLAYADFIIIVPTLLVIYKVIPTKNQKKKIIEGNYPLEDDNYIQSSDQDKLGRKEFADLVAKYIIEIETNKPHNSIAIGINAQWGDGKTSFQEMISEKLQSYDSDAIILKVNVWKSLDDKKIIQDFFELYSQEIGRYDLSLGKQIHKYGRKLLSSSSSWWATLALEIITSKPNQDEMFLEINKSIRRIKRKIVVFIDDVDRLSSEEIMEVIKLIRNSASFQNTVFIVGYDKEYFTNAIKKHSEYGFEDYLNKIFQIQFELSSIPSNVIIQQLKEILEKMLPDYQDQIRKTLGYRPNTNEAFASTFLGARNQSHFIPAIITNIRDVKRFCNYFSLSFQLVASEVVFEDYFYISLLRYKYPTLLKKIRQHGKVI